MTTCSICLDPVDEEKNYLVTDCKHKFHFSCIINNIDYNFYRKGLNCPICRASLLPNRVTSTTIISRVTGGGPVPRIPPPTLTAPTLTTPRLIPPRPPVPVVIRPMQNRNTIQSNITNITNINSKSEHKLTFLEFIFYAVAFFYFMNYIDKHKSIIHTSEAIGNAVSYVPQSQPTETKSDNQKRTYPIMEISNYYDKHKDKKVEVICDNLIFNQGTTLIAGSDNTGKTWVAFHLAFSIALGKPFLSWETKKKPVLMVQFELRPHMIKERLDNLFKVYGTNVPNFKIASMSDDDLIFTDAWDKIFNTLKSADFKDGVVIIDNLYTSTDKDISDNQAMKPVLQMIRFVAKERNLAIVLIAHHNKPTGKDITTEPILAKPLIAGGKQLTNFVDNCLQLGISTFKDNLTRGKITKINTKQCNIHNQAFKIWWDEETCLLEYGGIIPNEKLHCEANKTRWEYNTIVEMSAYSETLWKSPRFDRAMLSEFLKDKPEFDRTLHKPDYIKNKTTRFINKVCDWVFVKKTGHNQYELINEVIAELDNT